MSIYRTRHSDISINSIRNSLTEILPNKTPNSIERSKFEQSQVASIVKAINNVENPVKEKHVRNIILGTFYDKSANLFWTNVQYKIQLQANPITCWKFCYTLHKLLRDGHPTVLPDSYRFNKNLVDLAKLWVHLRQDYGDMINAYCYLLQYKLNFHNKNQNIPGNLVITDRDLHLITNNDINNYFQLCCEFFDYIDEIIKLQVSIFSSMDRNRSNSMTDSGQCKLSPLIMCIQESAILYDFCVKFLFKLHDNLSSEILDGHRQRFLKQFKALKDFYEACKNLQYFKNLIQIPDLPNSPPNFRIHTEFQTYVKPVAVVPEPEPEITSLDDEPSNELLVDLSNDNLYPPIQEEQRQELENVFARDSFVQYQNYINEIERLRAEIDRLKLESEIEIRGLRDRIKHLENELLTCKTELEQQKIRNRHLEEQLKINSENEKAKEELELLEKKAVSSEEKFNKMKELYAKLRDEHVTLLKQDSEVRKQLSSVKESCNHITEVKNELEKRLNGVNDEKSKLEKSLQLKLDELQEIKVQSEKQNAELILSSRKFDNDIIEFRHIKAQLEEQLNEARLNIEKLNNNEKEYENKIKSIESIANSLKDELKSVKGVRERLESDLTKLNGEKLEAEKTYLNDKEQIKEVIIKSTIEQCKNLIKEALHKFDDPILLNCKSGAEFLLTLLTPFLNSINQMKKSYEKFYNNGHHDNELVSLVNGVYAFATNTVESLISGKITSLTAADIDKGALLADSCQNAGNISIELLDKIKTKNNSEIEIISNKLEQKINSIIEMVTELLPKIHDISKEELGDLVDQEMHNTSQTIESAVAKLESLMNKTREKDSGVKLEVNDKILDACTALMKAIKLLIAKAKDLQKEIVAQGRGTSSVKEFYAKNHKWTEGLVSAAKLVGLGASVLIEKADKLVQGNGKLEEIIVCSNEIAASTAQLVVSSNVKANRESQNRRAVVDARNDVATATANLVASAKSCLQIIEDQTAMDFTKMSLHQTKRMEMEAQVKVLELEKLLDAEKRKLFKLRKQHYTLAGETEGWDQESIPKN